MKKFIQKQVEKVPTELYKLHIELC